MKPKDVVFWIRGARPMVGQVVLKEQNLASLEVGNIAYYYCITKYLFKFSFPIFIPIIVLKAINLEFW